jgi:hypothetical protein
VPIFIMGRIQRQLVILLTAATIITGISTVAMLMPQAVYASDDDDDNDGDCASDEQPASIDGTIRCMGGGECYSEQFKFEGKGVKHCNSMMTDE